MATLAEKVNALPDRFKNNLTKEQQKSFVRAAIASGDEQSFYGMMADKRAFDAYLKNLPRPKIGEQVKRRRGSAETGAKQPTEEDREAGKSKKERAARRKRKAAAVRKATIEGDTEALKKLGVQYEPPLGRGISLTEGLTPELLQTQGFISEDMSPSTKSLIYLTALRGAMLGDFYMIDAELGAAGKALKVGKAFQPKVLDALNESTNVLKQIEFRPRQPMQRGGLFGSRAGMADLDLLSGGSTGLIRKLGLGNKTARVKVPDQPEFPPEPFQGFEPVAVSPAMKKGRKAVQDPSDIDDEITQVSIKPPPDIDPEETTEVVGLTGPIGGTDIRKAQVGDFGTGKEELRLEFEDDGFDYVPDAFRPATKAEKKASKKRRKRGSDDIVKSVYEPTKKTKDTKVVDEAPDAPKKAKKEDKEKSKFLSTKLEDQRILGSMLTGSVLGGAGLGAGVFLTAQEARKTDKPTKEKTDEELLGTVETLTRKKGKSPFADKVPKKKAKETETTTAKESAKTGVEEEKILRPSGKRYIMKRKDVALKLIAGEQLEGNDLSFYRRFGKQTDDYIKLYKQRQKGK